MITNKKSSFPALDIDCHAEVEKITKALRDYLINYKKKGYVIALSGGVDSSVVGALCMQAVGADRVFGLLMPERESSDDTLKYSQLIAEHLGIRFTTEDITGILKATGSYARRDYAIKMVVHEYNSSYKCKILLPGITENMNYSIFSVVVESPTGVQRKARLTPQAYLGIVAATNFKQRIRKMLEYYHADRLNYAVTGTPNRQEYDQGFFVKQGDGAADIKPIAHLYKTQVYQLAQYLNIPEEIQNRMPTTDTYSMAQTQEEFFFSLAYDKMDICLYAKDHDIPASEIVDEVGFTADQIEHVYRDIDSKRNAAKYLHSSPALVEKLDKPLVSVAAR